MNMIGFPEFGLTFSQNPVILRISDSFALTWYGLILAVGFLFAVLYCLRKSKHFGLRQEEILDMLFFATPAGIIGARLYYVAFNWEAQGFSEDPWRIIKTWEGGLAIHGAIIGAATAAYFFCRVRKISPGAMLDIGAAGLLIGQAGGRWGNFVNGEVYGYPTELPWRMLIPNGREVHPLFLYESLWNLAGLILLACIIKRRKYNGQMFTVYVAWYGLGRGLLEGMRAEQFNLMAGDFMVSRIAAWASFAVAVLLLAYMTFFRKHPPLLEWTKKRDARLRSKNKDADPEDNAADEPAGEETENNGDSDGRSGGGEESEG